MMAKVKMIHVPFKGNVEGVMALAGGQIDVLFPTTTSAMPLLKAGKFRALAVTSTKRSASLPSIPTLDESGLSGFDLVAWFGVIGPAGMPRPIVEKLNAAVVKVANEPEFKEAMANQGMDLQSGSPEMFGSYLRGSGAQIFRLGKQANIKLE